MKIKNKTFSYGVTLSKNYNTVRVDESVEVELNESPNEQSMLQDKQDFNILKQSMKDRVLKQAREELIKVLADEQVVNKVEQESDGLVL